MTIFCGGLFSANPVHVVEDSRLLLSDVLLQKVTSFEMPLMIVLMGGEDGAPETIDLAGKSQCIDILVRGQATDSGSLFEDFHHLQEACARLTSQVE